MLHNLLEHLGPQPVPQGGNTQTLSPSLSHDLARPVVQHHGHDGVHCMEEDAGHHHLVEEWDTKSLATIHQLQALLGKLLHIAHCCSLARLFVNGMLATLRKV